MAQQYSFNDRQNEYLALMTEPENENLWACLLYTSLGLVQVGVPVPEEAGVSIRQPLLRGNGGSPVSYTHLHQGQVFVLPVIEAVLLGHFLRCFVGDGDFQNGFRHRFRAGNLISVLI